jgi:hypothetical protein
MIIYRFFKLESFCVLLMSVTSHEVKIGVKVPDYSIVSDFYLPNIET